MPPPLHALLPPLLLLLSASTTRAVYAMTNGERRPACTYFWTRGGFCLTLS